jgi:hypothetical protein
MDDPGILELQGIDSALDRLRHRRAVVTEGSELAAVRASADGAESALGELGLRIDAIDRDAGRLDHEVDTLRQKLAAEERRLFDGSVANAKELGSIQREVDNLKRRISDREDEELALLEQREAVASAAAEAATLASASRTEWERAAAAADTELAKIDRELEQRRAERDALAPRLPAELLELYEELRAQKKGVGAAALVDGVCQGCHEQLSAVELDRVRRAEGVRRCDHCRRILVL